MNSRRQGDDNVKTNRQTAGSVGELKWCVIQEDIDCANLSRFFPYYSKLCKPKLTKQLDRMQIGLT